jgi:hypothetical protein
VLIMVLDELAAPALAQALEARGLKTSVEPL